MSADNTLPGARDIERDLANRGPVELQVLAVRVAANGEFPLAVGGTS